MCAFHILCWAAGCWLCTSKFVLMKCVLEICYPRSISKVRTLATLTIKMLKMCRANGQLNKSMRQCVSSTISEEHQAVCYAQPNLCWWSSSLESLTPDLILRGKPLPPCISKFLNYAEHVKLITNPFGNVCRPKSVMNTRLLVMHTQICADEVRLGNLLPQIYF